MTMLKAAETHTFRFQDRLVVLDIRRNRLFQLDEAADTVLAELSQASCDQADLVAGLQDRLQPDEARQVLEELRRQGLVFRADENRPPNLSPEPSPVRTICLNLIHSCNLRCTYCYGGGGEYGSPRTTMSLAVAVEAVEFLLDQLPANGKGRVLFFGGEPLLRWPLLTRLIPYIRRREDELGKPIELSVTTNGTLLDEQRIQYLVKHGVQVNVSLDGPAAIHNRQRVFPDGLGSYAAVVRNLPPLFTVQKRRFLRATLDPCQPQLTEVVNHLLELGANFVHIEPASEQLGAANGGLSSQSLDRLVSEYDQLKEQTLQMLQEEGVLLPVYAYVRVLRLLAGQRQLRRYGCGMGRSYIAVSPQGELYPCHRFVDQPAFRLGDLQSGFQTGARQAMEGLMVDQRVECSQCWARYLCGGGCYYEAAVTHGRLQTPDLAHCFLTRHIIEDAIEIATYLSRSNLAEIRMMASRFDQTIGYL